MTFETHPLPVRNKPPLPVTPQEFEPHPACLVRPQTRDRGNPPAKPGTGVEHPLLGIGAIAFCPRAEPSKNATYLERVSGAG